MMKRQSRLFVSLLGSLFFLFPFSVQGETLADVVEDVVATNPDVRAPAYNRLAREQEVKQAQSGYYPKLDIEGGLGHTWVQEPFSADKDPSFFYIKLRQNLFTGFATMNESERQQARVLSQAYIVRAAAENAALDTARVYLDVLRAQELLELARENLQIHERINDQIGLRSESGVGRKADNDQSQSRLQFARSNVVVAEQNLLDAESNYQRVVGHLPQRLERPESMADALPQTLDAAIDAAVMQHPTLQSAYADVRARVEQRDAAASPFYPVIDLELDKVWERNMRDPVRQYDESRSQSGSENWEDLRFLVRLRYNLFEGFKDKARKDETVQLIKEAREIRNHTYRQVVESVSLSWRFYEAALRRQGFLEERVAFASVTSDLYTKQWNIGERTLLDVLDAEAERINARKDLINEEFNGIFAEYRILTGIGQLLPAFGLPWPQEGEVEEEIELAGRLDERGEPIDLQGVVIEEVGQFEFTAKNARE